MKLLMSEEERKKAIEGCKDILSEQVELDDKVYSNSQCPWCKSNGLSKELNMDSYMKNDRIVPKYNLRCVDCNCLFSPFDGIVLEIGNVAKEKLRTEGV